MKQLVIVGAVVLCISVMVVSQYGGVDVIVPQDIYETVQETPRAIQKQEGTGNASLVNKTTDLIRVYVTFEDNSIEQFSLQPTMGVDFGREHPHLAIKTIAGNYATNGMIKQIMAYEGLGKNCVIYGPITSPEYDEPYYAVACDAQLKY